MSDALTGRHSAVVVTASEGLRLARDLGQHMAVCSCESALAWLAAINGDEATCHDLASDAVQLSQTYQLPAIAVFATWARGLLDLGLGRPAAALDRLLDRSHGPLVVPTSLCLVAPDLIEAGVLAGRTDGLREILAWFEKWAACTGQAWAAAVVHRCRAILGEDAESHYEQAVRLHEQAGPDHRPYDRARTQLSYGRWLRRARRRLDARVQLTAAREAFAALGANPWAEQAALELRATGQSIRRRGDPTHTRLTPQEMQVVGLVAEGLSNKEVAAKLFLSPRTVAYHLYKAYPKLGIASRADLIRIDLNAVLTTP
jgi:DNA-binding CsgD family transcriptional regulator